MKTHLAYCSACDRDIEVTLAPGYEPQPGEPIPPEALVCVDHGEVCTGAMCPLFNAPPRQVNETPGRSGLGRS